MIEVPVRKVYPLDKFKIHFAFKEITQGAVAAVEEERAPKFKGDEYGCSNPCLGVKHLHTPSFSLPT